MRVCLDIQSALAQRAGVGRYTRELAQRLAALRLVDELALFHFDFRRAGLPFAVPGAVSQAVRWCPGRLVQAAWKTLNWPPFDWFAGKADVYHFPNFIVPPLRGGRTVATVHDLSFLRFPQFAEERNRRYLSARIRDTVARADAVIADSQSGAAEIVEDLGVPADRVVPIHLGIGPEFRRPSPEYVVHVLRRLAIDRPYLLTVGTVEPRKNLPFLVEVFERLTAFDGLLVIAGACGWKYEPILARMRRSPRADSIRYLEYADEADLPSLYAGAAVFLCASFYEGFGFPPLEAMACGTPVVSSPGGSLAEMLGDAAVLPDTFDAGRWTTEIELLLSDTDRRAQLIEAGAGRAASYTWDETARRTADLYRRVLS